MVWERNLLPELCEKLLQQVNQNMPITIPRNIPQTAYLVNKNEIPASNSDKEDVVLASHEDCLKDKNRHTALPTHRGRIEQV